MRTTAELDLLEQIYTEMQELKRRMENTLKRVQSQNNYGTGEVTAIQNRKFIGAVMRYATPTPNR